MGTSVGVIPVSMTMPSLLQTPIVMNIVLEMGPKSVVVSKL
jgi:hypothetical protein